jgi:DNA mismatch repair protein MutL
VNRIKILSRELSQMIAAGEVVERPASVVKELVENALDAGADEIAVDLQAGGKALIRVRDNGGGMGREDAVLAFVRHATSKVASETDLAAIATLGFRGEALASISAVSRLTLRTSEGTGAPGTQVEREGDVELSVRDIGFPRGTEVEVRDLFFNLPARLKFLRSDASELGLVVKYLTNVALAYPQLRLAAAHGRRNVLACQPVEGLKERIFQLYGKSVLETLMPVAYSEGESAVSGFASRPPEGRPDRSHQLFFVNARPVRDKVLASALNQAFRGFLEKERSPEAFLFVTLPFGDVDVNVHPAKSEVRFRNSQAVFQLVRRGIEKARLKASGVKDLGSLLDERSASAGQNDGESIEPAVADAVRAGIQGVFDLRVAEEGREFSSPGRPPDRAAAEAAVSGSGLRLLGQFVNSYIVAEAPDALLVIDQHNAHERVLYDRYAEIDRQRKWPAKLSLIPLVFELGPAQEIALEAGRASLEEAGFRVEAMGGRSHSLREYPAIFEPEKALGVVLAALEEEKDQSPVERKESLLATMACKTAVKAGESLPREKMSFLLQELFRSSNPGLCPHGRPIVVRIPKSQIEKNLRRPSPN